VAALKGADYRTVTAPVLVRVTENKQRKKVTLGVGIQHQHRLPRASDSYDDLALFGLRLKQQRHAGIEAPDRARRLLLPVPSRAATTTAIGVASNAPTSKARCTAWPPRRQAQLGLAAARAQRDAGVPDEQREVAGSE
jgi:hypothetical protein